MKHEDAAGLTIAKAERAYGDLEILTLLIAAETEVARLEAMDVEHGLPDPQRGMLKIGAYRDADYQRGQLRDELHRRLREGELMATARERPVGPRIDVPASAWQHLYPTSGDSTARDGWGQVALYDVRVAVAEPAATLTPDAAPAPRADVEPVPVYSPAVLRGWYRLRCAGWPATQPPPNEAEDRAAASRHFDRAIPRSALRTIRRELAPSHWLKPGPRKALP